MHDASAQRLSPKTQRSTTLPCSTETVLGGDTPSFIYPRFATEPTWRAISGMTRSRTYEELAAGNLRGKKLGKRLLIDVEHGLRWLESLPAAKFRASKKAA